MGICSSTHRRNNHIREFIKNIEPLDLIVFRGSDFVSDIIGGAESMVTGNGSVTHVEVMITPEWCSSIDSVGDYEENPGIKLSWGSTMSQGNVSSVETGKSVFGVQIRDLELLINDYTSSGGNVGYCKLLHNPTLRRDDETLTEYLIRRDQLKNNLAELHRKYHNRPYNANPLALLGVMFPIFRGLRDEVASEFCLANKWLFCSEFIADLYIDLGIINDSTDGKIDGKVLNPADVLPVDFLGYDADHQLVNAICKPPVWLYAENKK